MSDLACLGRYEPDVAGIILGTGFNRFESPDGINGLAEWRGDRIEILAVVANNPGQGNFKKFIADLKREFRTICIWEIWNPWLGDVLKRYGFTDETDIRSDGESVTGMRWDRV